MYIFNYENGKKKSAKLIFFFYILKTHYVSVNLKGDLHIPKNLLEAKSLLPPPLVWMAWWRLSIILCTDSLRWTIHDKLEAILWQRLLASLYTKIQLLRSNGLYKFCGINAQQKLSQKTPLWIKEQTKYTQPT